LAGSFNAMLEHIEQDFRRLSNFSADIAHELRTPVTNLTTQTQVLLSQSRGADAYREVLYSNLEEYERMAKMISDMLYLAQTDNQLIKPDLAEVDMASELDALFEYFEPWAEERHVQLKRVGQIPPLRGDRLMLRRTMSNLLSNAIRHTTSGQAVTVSLRQDQQSSVITVSNPGDTIAAEHLPHLFDRFYRADPSRQRNGDGAGLGLAIVKAIVEAHGGEIVARSSHGNTAFEMRLPCSLA
jgi:two-component system heavy metal sensor histidine kinase CusS